MNTSSITCRLVVPANAGLMLLPLSLLVTQPGVVCSNVSLLLGLCCCFCSLACSLGTPPLLCLQGMHRYIHRVLCTGRCDIALCAQLGTKCSNSSILLGFCWLACILNALCLFCLQGIQKVDRCLPSQAKRQAASCTAVHVMQQQQLPFAPLQLLASALPARHKQT